MMEEQNIDSEIIYPINNLSGEVLSCAEICVTVTHVLVPACRGWSALVLASSPPRHPTNSRKNPGAARDFA
jgi:hypothetical protein